MRAAAPAAARATVRAAVRATLAGAVIAVAGAMALPAAGQDPPAADPSSDDPVARGAYVFAAAGCLGCHTDVKGGGTLLAGGRALETPFGTFHSPNITPHPQHGIGAWSEADFVRAFRDGRRPDGDALFPAFPYGSYTGMTERDLLDLRAYLFSLPAADTPNRPHDLDPPFGWRFLLPVWQWLYLERGPLADDPSQPPEWNRGRYLVDVLGHCGECHTPRSRLGGLDRDAHMAGNRAGPEGEAVPNISPNPERGIGAWSIGDIELFLEIGMMPDGDFAGGSMGEVITNSTSKLTAEDRRAIAVYLKSLPPQP
ncbi:c-type cytochrome [Azospirillum halopraeferens]|uniref:c-type cytochrome n=1 Tax=Azospirillum halopraeferens TaxID=34010 RepID=UPI000413CD30|nr:cytochrome c [Azospirillum halopraeferens]